MPPRRPASFLKDHRANSPGTGVGRQVPRPGAVADKVPGREKGEVAPPLVPERPDTSTSRHKGARHRGREDTLPLNQLSLHLGEGRAASGS